MKQGLKSTLLGEKRLVNVSAPRSDAADPIVIRTRVEDLCLAIFLGHPRRNFVRKCKSRIEITFETKKRYQIKIIYLLFINHQFNLIRWLLESFLSQIFLIRKKCKTTIFTRFLKF